MRKFIVAAAVAVAFLFSTASKADAAFVFGISFTTTSGTTTIYDGGAGDTNGAAGKIGYSGVLDGFDITVFLSTRTETPSLAQVAIGSLDLNNTLSTSNSITIRAVATDFATGVNSGALLLSSSVSGMVTPGVAGETSQVKFQSFADAGNNEIATFPYGSAFSTPQLDSGLLTSGDGSSVGFNLKTSKLGFDPSSVYSLGSELQIQLSGGSSLNAVSGKTEIATPAPAGLVLALSGTPLLGFGAWLRRRRNPIEA